jgi:hypothetical protein
MALREPGGIHGISRLVITGYDILLFPLHGPRFNEPGRNSFIFAGENRTGNINKKPPRFQMI